MTNSYLLEVIKALNPIERQEVVLFLASPYFNKGGNVPELARLYQVILDAAPDFSEELLTKEKVYHQVFSDPNIIPGKLEKLMAALNKLLRVYALNSRYFSESNEIRQQVDWAAWLRERGLTERSTQVLAKLKNQTNTENLDSLERYHSNFLIAEEEHQRESFLNQLKGDLNIPNLIYSLELYYHNYRTELINRYLLQQKAPQLPDLQWENISVKFWEEESVLLQISKSINSILRQNLPSSEEFFEFMQLLHGKADNLSFETIAQFYAYLRSICTLLINGGHLEFIPILHNIHIDNLQRGYFFTNGELTPLVYLNIVQIATRAKEYAWAKEFTEKYKHSIIGGDEEQFFYHLNMAQCLFAEGNFEESLSLLPDAPSASHYHHIVRRLELKNYYELKSDLLPYKIDAFRKFIERTGSKTIAPDQKTMHINFVNFLHQLSQSPIKDKTRSARLVERIERKHLVAERAWLLEKAREVG
ncbi:MAG: hypothetical protein KIS77_03430 [Saprospiraceae bacterium]|nr:hypothetical protein [Saprospiraceae bacterium]